MRNPAEICAKTRCCDRHDLKPKSRKSLNMFTSSATQFRQCFSALFLIATPACLEYFTTCLRSQLLCVVLIRHASKPESRKSLNMFAPAATPRDFVFRGRRYALSDLELWDLATDLRHEPLTTHLQSFMLAQSSCEKPMSQSFSGIR